MAQVRVVEALLRNQLEFHRRVWALQKQKLAHRKILQQVRQLLTCNPVAAWQQNPIERTSHHVGQNERWMPGPASRREHTYVSDLVAQHRHRVRLKFSDQNRRLRSRRLRFNEYVGPVECVFERFFWPKLDAHADRKSTR